MLLEYHHYESKRDLYAEVDLEREVEYYDTPEGTAELNKIVSQVTGLPVGSFKVLNFIGH